MSRAKGTTAAFDYAAIKEEIVRLFKQYGNKTRVAEQIKAKYKIPASEDSIRRAITRHCEGHAGLAQECEAVGIPVESVGHYWYKGKHYSIHAKPNKLDYFEAIREIVESLPVKKTKPAKQGKLTGEKALKATLADMHVGMEPDPEGKSLFGYEYNKGIFMANLERVYQSILKEHALHGKFDLFLLDDLGDGIDGQNGKTTRGGHTLPQNMDNIEMFKAYVYGKLDLIERVHEAGIADKIIVRNITNDNHGGDFAHVANVAIQMILERTYEKQAVEFSIVKRFMEHFKYGNHTFIITHGKDDQFMKFGLPYQLNDKTVKFINDYIEHYRIKTKYIHLEKGDLHQIGYQRTKRFDYRNFMSFAPPSSYSQLNFGDGYGGYSIQVIPKFSGDISHTDYFLEFEKQKAR